MTVSILIPHWNRQALLMPLLQSIREQRLPQGVEVEVLVVDNGSTDESASVAEQEGFQVLRLGRNEGVSRALNRGIAACRGEWVAVLNNDVELTPDWLSPTFASYALRERLVRYRQDSRFRSARPNRRGGGRRLPRWDRMAVGTRLKRTALSSASAA